MDRTLPKGSLNSSYYVLQYPFPPPPRVLQRSLHPPYCLAAGEHYLLRLQIHSEDADDQLNLAVSLRWYYILIVITIIPNNSCCVSGSGSWANHSNTLVLPCHQRRWDAELLCHVVLSSSYTFLPLHFENLRSHLFMVFFSRAEGWGRGS